MNHTNRPFRPLPLLGNPHLQTILGSLLKGPPFPHPTQIWAVELPDGDRLALHDSVPPNWQDGDPIALIVHGLGGSPNSGFVRRTALGLWSRGVRPVRIDLRGSGAGISWARKAYNAGCSDDIRAVVAELHRQASSSPIWLFGFSLGGNVVLKTAGEMDTHPVDGITKVIAVAPPIDLPAGSILIAGPKNRLYDWYFSRDLVRLVHQRAVHFPEMTLPKFPRKMTLKRFDDLMTAPMWGFPNADAYYEWASSGPLIERIPVPTFILTAADDPVIPVEPFHRLKVPTWVEIRITDRGGHVGYLGWADSGSLRWGEHTIIEWAMNGPR